MIQTRFVHRFESKNAGRILLKEVQYLLGHLVKGNRSNREQIKLAIPMTHRFHIHRSPHPPKRLCLLRQPLQRPRRHSTRTLHPKVAVDEHSFELAKWLFDAPFSEMSTIFTNLDRFLDINNPATHLSMLS